MNFDADRDSIKGLLGTTRTYEIPRFQRDFSWETRHYSDFFYDMLSQLRFNDSKFETSQYYLGNMLFLGNKDDASVEVIDGQQRLTTTTILLAAIRDALFDISETEGDDAYEYANTIQSEYIVKKVDGKPQRKLKTKTSYPYFTQTIQDYATKNSKVQPKTEEEEALEKTSKFFTDLLKVEKLIPQASKSLGKNLGEEHYLITLRALRDQLLASEIVTIFVADRDQVNRIFENINSKGKPLSQVDLIKNSIFSIVRPTEAGVDEINIRWNNMNNKIKDIDTSFNEFFLHFWKANYPGDRSNGSNLYAKYTKRFRSESKESLQDLVTSIASSLDAYIEIVEPDANNYRRQEKKPEGDYLTSISRFRGIQVRVPLLSLYTSQIQMKQSEKIRFLQFLSSFHFAAFGTEIKLRSNKTSQPYRNFSKKVNSATDKETVRSAAKDLEKSLRSLLDEKAFIDAFAKLEFSKKDARVGFSAFPAQYAIKQISNSLEGCLCDDSEYSIEHIVDEDHGNGASSIGNLIVLETKLNNKVNKLKQENGGEITFAQKLEIYRMSKYKMVQKFIEEYPHFTHEDIAKRAQILGGKYWSAYLSDEQDISFEGA